MISEKRRFLLQMVTELEAFDIIVGELERCCKDPETGARIVYAVATLSPMVPGTMVLSEGCAKTFEDECEKIADGQLSTEKLIEIMCRMLSRNAHLVQNYFEEFGQTDHDWDVFVSVYQEAWDYMVMGKAARATRRIWLAQQRDADLGKGGDLGDTVS